MITTLRIRVFVPVAIAETESVAKTRAAMYAHLGGMATPVAEEVRAVPGGHHVTLAEFGDVHAHDQARGEKR